MHACINACMHKRVNVQTILKGAAFKHEGLGVQTTLTDGAYSQLRNEDSGEVCMAGRRCIPVSSQFLRREGQHVHLGVAEVCEDAAYGGYA